MKMITIQQPWAWAIFNGKDIENRTWLTKHRGPLAIHAGKRWSNRGAESPLVTTAAWKAWDEGSDLPRPLAHRHGADFVSQEDFDIGAVLGTVNLVDSHWETDGCCSDWAESSYLDADGVLRTRIAHHVYEDPVRFDEPIPAKGALNIRTIKDPNLVAAIRAAA